MFRRLEYLWALLVVGLVWELVVRVFDVPEYVLPAVSSVAHEFREGQDLWRHFLVTLLESFVGLLIAWAFAAVSAVILFLYPIVERSVMPVIVGFKAIPLVALAPLIVLWFGNGFVSKALMAATICFFPVVVGYLNGFRACTDDEVLFLRSLRLSRFRELRDFRLLKAAPFWLAGLRVASVLAVVGAVVAEFTGANQGLGYVVIVAAVRIDTPLLMVGIILSALCGISLYILAVGIERLLLQSLRMEPLPE